MLWTRLAAHWSAEQLIERARRALSRRISGALAPSGTLAAIRLSLTLVIWTAAVIAFPKRKHITGVGHELDDMLAEGQGGFTDMMKGAMARE